MRIVLFVWMLSSLLLAEQFCIVVEENAIVTNHHTNNTVVNIKNKFGYGFMVGKENQQFVEIIKNSKTIGWVDKKFIKCSKDVGTDPYMEALKVKTIDGNDSVLYKKSFITNSVLKDGNISTVQTLPRFLSSTTQQRSPINSNLYEIYFILKETNDRLLLSKEPLVNGLTYDDNSNNSIIGWVDRKHLKIWNSRVAIEPEDNSIVAHWKKNFHLTYEEVISKPKGYFSLRYPQLEEVPNGIKISYMQKEGAFGYQRDKFSKVLAQSSPYIVFLIDATAGMKNYMNNVKDGISDFLKTSSDLKVAIVLYRDYCDNKDKYRLLTKGFVSPNKAISLMKGSYFKEKSNPTDSVGSTYNGNIVTLDRSRSEALFNGIITLCNDKVLKLDDFANPTRIILIGDHGNHTERNDDKGYSIEDVKNAMGNKVAINAIQVHTNVTKNKEYEDRFKNQIEKINSLRRVGSFIRDNNGSRATIKKAIASSVQQSMRIKSIVRKVVGGNNLTQKEKDLLDIELGIDGENLGVVQQSLELYINDNQRSKYQRVILSENYFVDQLASSYANMAKTITHYNTRGASLNILKISLANAITLLTGQSIAGNINVSEFLEQKLKIPKSKILNFTFNEWIDKLARNDNNYRANLIKEFSKKSLQLRSLTVEQYYDNISFDKNNKITYAPRKDGNGNTVVRKTKFNISIVDRNGTFNTNNSSNTTWIWVPFEYLP